MIVGESESAGFAAFVDPVDGTRWSVDVEFLASSWRCRWGDGCLGILDEPAAELGQGCCSVGAELLDEDEARLIGALGVTLDPARFQFHAEAASGGVVGERGGRPGTRVVDGACIFLNRPGFAGGAGCALHLAAVDEGEQPIDWKPSVCWQLPLKVEVDGEGSKTLRRWSRTDWGAGGESMAWCCTEEPGRVGGGAEPVGHDESAVSAFDGDRPAAETLAEELQALVGPEVAVAIRARVAEGGADSQDSGERVSEG